MCIINKEKQRNTFITTSRLFDASYIVWLTQWPQLDTKTSGLRSKTWSIAVAAHGKRISQTICDKLFGDILKDFIALHEGYKGPLSGLSGAVRAREPIAALYICVFSTRSRSSLAGHIPESFRRAHPDGKWDNLSQRYAYTALQLSAMRWNRTFFPNTSIRIDWFMDYLQINTFWRIRFEIWLNLFLHSK